MPERIRFAEPSDSEALLKIYAPYVAETAVSFETTVPSIDEFENRILNISNEYPYLVYCIDDCIAGYAYASRHKERAAYIYDAEASIYVDSRFHGKGIAGKLYRCLFEILREQGISNVYAGYTEPNPKSEHFHRKMGFTVAGTFHKTGYKFNKWHDVTWVEKSLDEHELKGRLKSIRELPEELISEILERYVC